MMAFQTIKQSQERLILHHCGSNLVCLALQSEFHELACGVGRALERLVAPDSVNGVRSHRPLALRPSDLLGMV